MRIDVIGRHMDITDAIREHAEEKTGKLDRFHDGLQQVTWTIERQERASGDEFTVELIVDVEHHNDFVSKETGADVYAAIDSAQHKAIRQLRDHNEKLHERR
ncbi:MAG: ribosome-associated translation inhibitor RaiA [Planctomycetota bacterium]